MSEETRELRVKFLLGATPEGMAADFMTEDDWDKYRKYQERLKEEGNLGKETEVIIRLSNDPINDSFFEGSGLVFDLDNIRKREFKPLKFNDDNFIKMMEFRQQKEKELREYNPLRDMRNQKDTEK